MIPLENLIAELKKVRPTANLTLISKAYELSKKAHEGQKRKSGEPYFAHPVEVAHILASHWMDEETIATGLLHDVVEDTLISLGTLEKEFGKEIAELVDGVTKLSQISFRSKDVRQSESFRKMLLAMAQDIRVIIVKLADRLHNMRTLEHMSEMRQQAIAQETLDIYAPLANRLGISWLKSELEDLALKFLKPVIYQKLLEKVQSSQVNRDRFIAKVISFIGEKVKAAKIPCEITGRHKHLYSIFKKMETRDLEFDQINDILAFRIIVDGLSQCYEVLGHIHSIWKPVPGRFKDYIALPKANMYQSLHTTVIGPDGERVEIQIRTWQMHRVAEEGVAAHWIYKESGGIAKKKDIEQFKWLRHMLEWQQDLTDSHEFIETVKIDLFADEVYVFSPKGDVLELPRGATPIDFAYRVHTEVGHHCRGAKINGKIVPLKYKLQNGDTVEILTDPQAHPSKDWLKIAVTSKAKSKIRIFIKKNERDTGRAVGKEILAREFRKFGENYERLLSSGALKTAAIELGFEEYDDLLLAIGYGTISPHTIVEHLLSPEKYNEFTRKQPSLLKNIASKFLPKQSSPIKVGGMDDVMMRYGKCCDPLPGDSILGFVTRGRGVTVHKTNCYKILEIDSARKVDVEWTENGKSLRSVRIKIVSVDTPGILADISKLITKGGGNISHASITTTRDRKAVNTFDVDISNLSQLNALIRSIEKLKGIISVERIKG